ncbi:DUF4030 domain-containing protein [Scopulibacillus cellulosilyticus]|uniref:DUF4030 domain-containing protein n=1 Tax=Scopulibacillus cellulosilyticus TaxID=2665665 RepID=A0ABW2Q1V4_9BACL
MFFTVFLTYSHFEGSNRAKSFEETHAPTDIKRLRIGHLDEVIKDELNKKGYKISLNDINIPVYTPHSHKILNVKVKGTKTYYNKVKSGVKETVSDVLKTRGYDAYTIKVSREKKNRPDSVDQKNELKINEEQKKYKELSNDISRVVEKYKMKIVFLTMDSKAITIELVGPKQDYIKTKKDILNQIKSVVQSSGFRDCIIKVRNIENNGDDKSQSEIKDLKWNEHIFPVILEEMMSKKAYHVYGFAYSFHPEPLQIIIKTSVMSKAPQAKELKQEIVRNIHTMLQSKYLAQWVDHEPYKVIVRGKDYKNIE